MTGEKMLIQKEINKNNRLADMISIHSRRKGKEMEPNKNRKKGDCEVCGAKNIVLNKANNKFSCGGCQSMQARINKYPEVVIAEFIRLQGTGYFPGSEHAGTDALKTELFQANNRLKEEKQFNRQAMLKLEDDLKVLSEKNLLLVAKVEAREREINAIAVKSLRPEHDEMQPVIEPEYKSLHSVLSEAFKQASSGKGKERHANTGEKFEDQKICEISRRVGLGFPVGQAIKKAEEACRLDPKAGAYDLLGAINYLAAAVIILREKQ